MCVFKSVMFWWCLVSCLRYITSINTEEDNYSLTIDLSVNDKPNKTSQAFINYLNFTINKCNLNIDVVNVPAKANGSFFVIQFHSFRANFNLGNEQMKVVSGRNTGLVQVNLQQGVKYRYQLKCAQELNNDVVKVLLAVLVYEKEDPVPGGCESTPKTQISPYQNITYNNDLVQVDVQSASIYNSPCENNSIEIEMYHMYMSERTLDENEYFQSVEKMLTYEDVISNAKKVVQPDGVIPSRRYYSAYLGTGTVYGVVAKYRDRMSAYIPAVSYACDINMWDEECVAASLTSSKITIAALLILGLLTLFIGHMFFTIVVGFILGLFTALTVYGLTGFVSGWYGLIIFIIFGTFLTLAWTSFWCRRNLPVTSGILSVFFLGYITCCIIYYIAAGDTEFLRRGLNYWGIIFGVIVVFGTFLVNLQFFRKLACSFLGASGVTISINYYAGGNLHYIFLNNLRRATVRDFNEAIIDPVFQHTDILLTVMWFLLLVTGIFVQTRNYGKTRSSSGRRTQLWFPYGAFENVNALYGARNNETTPLLN